MHKLLIALACVGTLAACSSSSEPRTPVVLNTCHDAQKLVHSNAQKIGQAFANKDAYTIGSLELQNREIISLNPDCFPKIQELIKDWKKMHKNMDM